MSSILESILGSANQGNITDLAEHFGIDEGSVKEAIGHLLPALSKGLQQHVDSPQSDEIMANSEQSQQYMDDDNSKIYSDDAVDQGEKAVNSLLGQDNAETVAQKAAESTGLSKDMIAKLMPMAATMLMGSSAKQASEGGVGSLLSFLDKNNDGSIADDVIGLAGKLFK